MSINCPVCDKDDQVQKASSIFDAGTTSGNYHGPTATVTYSDGKVGSGGGYISGVSTSASRLAQKLAPPVKPPKPSFTCSYYLGVGMMFVFGLLTLPPLIGGAMEGGGAAGEWFTLLVCPVSLIAIGAVITRKASSEKKRREMEYPKLLADWNTKIDRWNNLFYCHRDGTLFDQRTGEQFEFVED
jgi:hypothetical protein